MAVESSTTISGLNSAWPLGTDIKAEGDNHLRLIKSVLKAVMDDSGPTMKFTKPLDGTAQVIRGYLYGLVLANNGADANHSIDVAPGAAADDGTTPGLITLGTVITKKLNAAWAAGSGNGGWLDGASAPTGTCHFFVIGKSTDLTAVDVAASGNLAPTLPSGWDRKRRIGAVLRDATPVNRFFRQFNNRFILTVPVSNRSSATAVADTLLAFSVPLGIRVRPIIRQDIALNVTSFANVSFGDGDGGTANHQVQQASSSVNDTTVVDHLYSNTSGQLRFTLAITSGTVNGCNTITLGWWDDRGING